MVKQGMRLQPPYHYSFLPLFTLITEEKLGTYRLIFTYLCRLSLSSQSTTQIMEL